MISKFEATLIHDQQTADHRKTVHADAASASVSDCADRRGEVRFFEGGIHGMDVAGSARATGIDVVQ